MLYQGQVLQLSEQPAGLYRLCIDDQTQALNKLSQRALAELEAVLDLLESSKTLSGLLIISGKPAFIVGADIAEFSQVFALPAERVSELLVQMNQLFNRLEDLPCPTVSAISGLALGGGFELALATDFRVMAANARVGLPEVKLGLYPAWGGTVRLPRLIGIDNANDWICGGEEKTAAEALAQGAADAIVAADRLEEAGVDLLQRCAAGELNSQPRRQRKQQSIALPAAEQLMAFESAKALVKKKAGRHYPAPLAALMTMQQHALMPRDAAQQVEQQGFIPLAQGEVSAALISLFVKEHLLRKLTGRYIISESSTTQAAVLGAGIMGGGIACQAALKGVSVLLRDISVKALNTGLATADSRLRRRVERGRMSPVAMIDTLHRITPTQGFAGFRQLDVVVEAVTEKLAIKQQVLADVEPRLGDQTILTTNTSTLSIGLLAKSLQRPDRFCGLHFFNPVHRMPLVEVIRGPQTSDHCVSQAVQFALAIGKTPVVVNDCPGFLVNRILMAYLLGFEQLLRQGVSPYHIDKVMHAYGWPMGPAALLDAVGLDTASHAGHIMAAGYPERMAFSDSVIDRLYQQERLGEKNGVGFYRHGVDKKGHRQVAPDPDLTALLPTSDGQAISISDDQIVSCLMLPLLLETVRCLEERVVTSPVEADMAVVMGLGYPPFRGGPLHTIDTLGAKKICDQAAALSTWGELYRPPPGLQQMAAEGRCFFPTAEVRS
ncbi:fatty acid oxidation complex subunit alpha FadB [Pontibacter sp. JAM-7]|uniref:fatty acid oxidation complex subunit alpha FadB n=1 Tax=Pontibacter sp. JAM-7 TaxID=3366581 RepID=UPI003AF67DE9